MILMPFGEGTRSINPALCLLLSVSSRQWSSAKTECTAIGKAKFLRTAKLFTNIDTPQSLALTLGEELGLLFARAHRYTGQV